MKRFLVTLFAVAAWAGTLMIAAQAETTRYNFTTESAAAASRYTGKQVVAFDGDYAPGTIIVNTEERRLYFVLEGGEAIQYGVGVGRAGMTYSGTARIARKAEWPSWRPTAAMRQRQPDLPVYMEGGPNNPLGARALYLYEGGQDTLYRIHGTSEPWSIGQAMSSGCIRMLNEEVIDLYERVRVGAQVVVI
jgi:lipoprotein-anchoring transpeptidase ErfK/SrfK